MKMSKTCACGSPVSDGFARVYGDNDDNVHHCIDCLDVEDGGREALRRGAGAREDLEELVV